MRKKLLPLALLAGMISVSAQSNPSIAHIDDGTVFFVNEGAVAYHSGGVQTKGAGLLDVKGNVMISGEATDVFKTLDASGVARTVGAQNIILRMNNDENTSYGQLYVTGIPQANMTGFVTKEYRATSHGVFQQMALPFYKKKLTEIASGLGYIGFSNDRTGPGLYYWDNNGLPQFHHLKMTQDLSGRNEDKDTDVVLHNGAARYYIVPANTPAAGSNWNPSAQITNFEGQIFSDVTPITYTLRNAGYEASGSPVAYGIGNGRTFSAYREYVNSYLPDVWDFSSQGYFNATVGSENGTYGRNMYQFGNPFMTNIDLSTIGYNERTAGGDDGNTISNIKGIRYEATGVALRQNMSGSNTDETGTISTNFNGATKYLYVGYDTNGIPMLDADKAVIKPMQAFVIKLKDNSADQTLAFNTLRRFANQARLVDGSHGYQATNPYGVNNARNATNGTSKQLRVIGFDENNNEVARTYYVVSKGMVTGASTEHKIQVMATEAALSTREELPTGGEDTSLSGTYWLYANEANENDFQGKKIQMVADISKIKKYIFQISENGQSFADNQTDFVDGGKSFYIQQGNGDVIRIKHNQVLNATDYYAGLYYGAPVQEAQLATQNTKADANSDLYVAFEKDTRTHQVVFPKGWKKADITVFDMAGRRVVTEKEVDATRNFVLPISVQGSYIVEVVSNTGIKAVKKIVK